MRDLILIHEMFPPDGGENKPEEPICKKCLEILEECRCSDYDKLEEVELSRERAEAAMGRLKPISMEIIETTK